MKYAPVMWNIARAIGNSLVEEGHQTRYLLSGAYDWMTNAEEPRADVELISTRNASNPLMSLAGFYSSGGAQQVRKAFAKDPPRILIFVNLDQFVDRVIIREAKKANPHVRIILLIHEPYTEDKKVYGWKRAGLLLVYEALTRSLIRNSAALILPSPHAAQTWKNHSGRIETDFRMMPLPYLDERCPQDLPRTHISFVGQIKHAHQKGLDLFLELIEFSAQEGNDLQFRLVTGNNTDECLKELSPAARSKLEVVTGTPLTDAMINKALRSSFVAVALQRRVMQSGSVPIAMMNGTPMLVSQLPGLTQFIQEGENGMSSPLQSSTEERVRILQDIQQNIDSMSRSARRYYEENFDSQNVRQHIPWLLGEPGAHRPIDAPQDLDSNP